MYYQEKIESGKTYYKTSPDGKWELKVVAHADVIEKLYELTEEERAKVFNSFGYIDSKMF